MTLIETRMRDGVVLRGDLYRPSVEDRHPTLLIRTPYGKDGYRDESIVRSAVERGYAVVVQDVRGRYASDGVFDPYRQESRDGYDAIESLATASWSTGRIGTAGLSYPGAVQWLAAVEAPPHLACIFPAMCFSTARRFVYFGGAFDLSWISWAALNIAPEERRRRNLAGPRTPAAARAAWRAQADDAYRHLPLNSLPLLADVAPFYYEWLDHPDDGEYWDYANIERRHSQITVPSFNFSGWHDEGYGPTGAIANFTGLRASGATAAARAPRLVIGPWTHGDPTMDSTRVGDRDFGASAGLDYNALVLDWCDHHVKGLDNGVDREPAVRIFVMGANRWREEREWPVPGTTPRTLYLRSGGALSWDPPSPDEPADRYQFDPADPLVDPHFEAGLGPHDQRSLEARRDVLVFTSDPLADDVEVTGHLEFRLWIASTAPDSDVFARLLDVEPDGPAWNLMSPTLEVLRLRYRLDEREPDLLEPGRPYEVALRMAVTSNLFRRGHRIRLHVTSSFFPHLDRNPNTGRPVPAESRLQPATQTLFHDTARPSRVVLPVVGGG